MRVQADCWEVPAWLSHVGLLLLGYHYTYSISYSQVKVNLDPTAVLSTVVGGEAVEASRLWRFDMFAAVDAKLRRQKLAVSELKADSPWPGSD